MSKLQKVQVSPEMKVLDNTCRAFLLYERYTEKWLQKIKANSNKLFPNNTQSEIMSLAQSLLTQKVSAIRKALQANATILKQIVPITIEQQSQLLRGNYEITEQDKENVRTTLTQMMREWSTEGAKERDRCFKPILEELEKRYPSKRSEITVICPGCGLARLPFEIALLGFNSIANEFSFSMLLPANMILNKTSSKEQYEIFPFIHQMSNSKSTADQTKSIKIPDIDVKLPSDSHFALQAGDFIELYAPQPCIADCVVTCYFIDTSKNITEYIKTIYTVLKPGGIWINFGPLSYHYADVAEEVSVEFTLEEVMQLIKVSGFNVESEQVIDSCYTSNPYSMLESLYHCSFFVAKKIEKK